MAESFCGGLFGNSREDFWEQNTRTKHKVTGFHPSNKNSAKIEACVKSESEGSEKLGNTYFDLSCGHGEPTFCPSSPCDWLAPARPAKSRLAWPAAGSGS